MDAVLVQHTLLPPTIGAFTLFDPYACGPLDEDSFHIKLSRLANAVPAAVDSGIVGSRAVLRRLKTSWKRPKTHSVLKGAESGNGYPQLQDLPEEILLQILDLLEPVELLLTQRTSRLFMRLSYDAKFITRAGNPRWRKYAAKSLEPLFPSGALGKILSRDRYCAPCARFRQTGAFEAAKTALKSPIRCSRCRRDHPRYLFSPEQRARDATDRICIAREGRVTVCPHRSISWADVEKWKAEQPRSSSPSSTDSYTTKFRCRKCALLSTQPCRPPVSRCTVKFKGGDKSMAPRIRTSQRLGIFKLGKHEEVSLPLIKSLCANSPVRGALTRGIFCPHVLVEDGQLLVPFRSTACACITAHGVDPSKHGQSDFCCHCRAVAKPHHAGRMRPGRWTRHEYYCPQCRTTYSWKRKGAWMTVKVWNTIALGGDSGDDAAKSAWLLSLDTGSYGLEQDWEGRYVTWCDDVGCATRERWGGISRLFGEDFSRIKDLL